MFVRVKTTPNTPRKSVQIVESVRDGIKIKQRIVRYVAIAMDDIERLAIVDPRGVGEVLDRAVI